MPMNVNEGMHNPNIPFFPVRLFYSYRIFDWFLAIPLAIRTTNDESGRINN